jgi:hypothetical protein
MRHQNADVRAHQQIVRLRGKDLFQSSEAGHDPNILPFTTLSRTTYWRRSMSLLQHTCRYVRSLSPYASLFLVAIPFAIIEPLKIVAIFICGSGRWKTGLILERIPVM